MNCLWCDDDIIPETSWENFFLLSKPKKLCVACEEEMEFLKGDRCDQCSRRSAQSTCLDCKWWEDQAEWSDVLLFNHSVFTYNEWMKEVLTKWKYRGDYILATAFKDVFLTSFKKKFSTIAKHSLIVPIPLSDKRFIERGFNQAQVLADFLPFESWEGISRIHSEKQSKKTRMERISSNNPFTLNGSVKKPVILVDDIYTTGTTIRHAARLLKENGCPKVYGYTLIRG